MKVYLLNRNRDLVCVCSSKKTAIESAVDDAAGALLFQKFGDATDFRGALRDYSHVGIHGVWYEIKEANVL